MDCAEAVRSCFQLQWQSLALRHPLAGEMSATRCFVLLVLLFLPVSLAEEEFVGSDGHFDLNALSRWNNTTPCPDDVVTTKAPNHSEPPHGAAERARGPARGDDTVADAPGELHLRLASGSELLGKARFRHPHYCKVLYSARVWWNKGRPLNRWTNQFIFNFSLLLGILMHSSTSPRN